MNSLNNPKAPTGVLLNPVVRCVCGSVQFSRTYKATGYWIEYIEFEANGESRLVESFTDGVKRGRESKTIRCLKCGKRRPNPESPNDPSSATRPRLLERENDVLCDFINRELKMTGNDPRISELEKRITALSNV